MTIWQCFTIFAWKITETIWAHLQVFGIPSTYPEKKVDCGFVILWFCQLFNKHTSLLWFLHTQQTCQPLEPWLQRQQCVLTVEVGGDGVPGQEAVDGNLIDDVEQQEGHTGEAEGLQQTPCVAWRRRTATVSSPPPALSLRISTCYFCAQTEKKYLCWFVSRDTENFI